MQERIGVKVPDSLKGRVYFDERVKVLYIEGKHIKRDGFFHTYVKELYSVFGNFTIKENPKLVKEKLEETRKEKVYSVDQASIATLSALLRQAVDKKASDIHIEVRESGCDVYFRMQGLFQKVDNYSRDTGETIVSSLYNHAKGMSHQSFSIPEFQYARITREAPFMPPELEGVRIHRGPMLGGHYVVLRLLYRATTIGVKKGKDFSETVSLTLREYGYVDGTIKKVKMAIESGDGIILVAGPTGSGKSTALKLFLELLHILYPYKSVFTIENPPEYVIEGAKQLAVPEIEGWSFEKVLKEVLRSDPDVIMVGEIREPDTAKTVVQATLTGHQVFSTVHARNIASIVERIRSLGLDLSELIRDNIARLFIAQRLVPKLCPHCKEQVEFKEFGIKGYVARGCEKCNYTGVNGRVVLEEAVSFKEFEFYGDDMDAIERHLLESGESMMVKGLRLVLEGQISPITLIGTLGHWKREELYRAAEG